MCFTLYINCQSFFFYLQRQRASNLEEKVNLLKAVSHIDFTEYGCKADVWSAIVFASYTSITTSFRCLHLTDKLHEPRVVSRRG